MNLYKSLMKYIVKIIGVVPGFDESVLDGMGRCLVSTKVIEIESSKTKRVLNMVHN